MIIRDILVCYNQDFAKTEFAIPGVYFIFLFFFTILASVGQARFLVFFFSLSMFIL